MPLRYDILKGMKKIVLEKGDGIAEVIDRMLAEPDARIVIVVPRSSAIVRSMSNFRLLKREADAAGKDVAVESVDETVLAFAKENAIPASHPLWRGVRAENDDMDKGMSDIVPKSRSVVPEILKKKRRGQEAEFENEEEGMTEDSDEGEEEREEEETNERKPSKGRRPVMAIREEEEKEEESMEEEEEAMFSAPKGRNSFGSGNGSRGRRPFGDDDDNDDDNGPRKGIGGKVWSTIIVVILLFLGGAYVAGAYFDRANISITFKKTPWTWQGNLTVDKSVPSDDLANGVVAGQVFTSDKNVTDTFKASGQQNVSLKAKGTITIYNDYSTKPQDLIATTRFLTPDGKIFRITNNVTVPGATKTASGALTPSSITAPIVADQAGPAYDIGPVAKLTIPGFQGKPQESGFWGAITASTTGGFTGMRAVPTAGDVAAAQASTTADLQASLQGGFSGSYPNNFKILDGATQISMGKLMVNTTTDAQGNFTVFATATLSAIGFDETALKTALLGAAQGTEQSSTFADISLTYGAVSANFPKGQVSFSLSAQGDLEPAFSTVTFEQQILGKDTAVARTAIAGLPQLSNAEISVWPVWLSTVPSDPSRVHITVN